MKLIIFIFLSLCLGLIPFEVEKDIEINAPIYNWSHEDQKEFVSWSQKYGKRYDNQFELIHRMNTFISNRNQVDDHNRKLPNDIWSMNRFADQQYDELRERLFMRTQDLPQEQDWEYFNEKDINKIGDSFVEIGTQTTKTTIAKSKNWKKYLTEPQQQGMCGSCWAFATTDTLLSRLVIDKKSKLKPLSKQYILDCMPEGNGGCNGGSVGNVFRFIDEVGGRYEDQYREYAGDRQECEEYGGTVGLGQMKSLKSVKNPSINEVLLGLQSGPITALAYVDDVWFRYDKGVIDTCSYESGGQYIHAVVIYGYNSKGFLLKNSWGTDWGEGGFFEMQRKGDEKCLDKLQRITYPLIK